ncbi:MAG: N-acyl homoserine lactonase family protein [Acidimicrobiales bacterium]
MHITPLRCGSLDWPAADLEEGAEGRVALIVWSFLVRHPAGTLLFDTGMHPDLRADPHRRLGDLADYFGLAYGAGDDLSARLGAAEVDPDEVDVVVASHLHWDHCGGNALAPQARVVVQRREWAHATADDVDPGGYVRDDFDTGQDLVLVDGEHDVFGDGRVVCVPTYGHTPGHQSLRVRLADGEVLLAADACMLHRHLDTLRGASFDEDPAAVHDVLTGFAQARRHGRVVVCGHDELGPDAAGALAPEPPPAAATGPASRS